RDSRPFLFRGVLRARGHARHPRAFSARSGSNPCQILLGRMSVYSHRRPTGRKDRGPAGPDRSRNPQKEKRQAEACRWLSDLFRVLLGERGGLFAARTLIFLLKPVDAAGRIDQFLTTREEGMARGADFHANVALVRRPRFEHVAARTDYVDFVISRVNT